MDQEAGSRVPVPGLLISFFYFLQSENIGILAPLIHHPYYRFLSSLSTATTNSSPAKSTSSASGNNGGANLNSIASTGGGGGGSGTGSVGAAFEAFHQLKAQLDNSEHKVQALIDSNDDMRNEIAR